MTSPRAYSGRRGGSTEACDTLSRPASDRRAERRRLCRLALDGLQPEQESSHPVPSSRLGPDGQAEPTADRLTIAHGLPNTRCETARLGKSRNGSGRFRPARVQIPPRPLHKPKPALLGGFRRSRAFRAKLVHETAEDRSELAPTAAKLDRLVLSSRVSRPAAQTTSLRSEPEDPDPAPPPETLEQEITAVRRLR